MQAQAESTKNENRAYILQQKLEQAAAAAGEAQAALRREAAEELAARVKAAAAEARESGVQSCFIASEAPASCEDSCIKHMAARCSDVSDGHTLSRMTTPSNRMLDVCTQSHEAVTHSTLYLAT